jgi:hypothetical protein
VARFGPVALLKHEGMKRASQYLPQKVMNKYASSTTEHSGVNGEISVSHRITVVFNENILVKKILLILIVMACFAGTGWAQQLHQYKYGLYDDYFVNPAYVGNNDYYTLMTGYDTRFSGLGPASPRVAFINAHSKVGKGYLFKKDGKINKFFSKFGNSAFGFQGLYFNFGAQYEYNFGLTYGYHLELAPNIRTKRPRTLVLAFTPRIFIIGINAQKFVNNDGQNVVGLIDPIVPADLGDHMLKSNFTADVGALFQTDFYDVGLSVLNISNSKIGFERADIIYGQDTLAGNPGYGIYDSIYSSQIVLNAKVKDLEIHASRKFDVQFEPSAAFLYKPNARDFEVYIDLAVDWNFYRLITPIRKELTYNIQTGLYISHTRFYDPPITLLHPYIAINFQDFSIHYTWNFNPNVEVPGYWGGNQVTFTYTLGRDKVLRNVDNNPDWKVKRTR